MIREKPIGHDIYQRIGSLKTFLKGCCDIEFGYLFGGYGKGRVTALSDVDIAVYLKGEDLEYRRLELLGDITGILRTDEVDLVILNRAPVGLKMRILKSSLLLCDNQPFARHRFESLTFRMYFDWSKFENHLLERRFSHGR